MKHAPRLFQCTLCHKQSLVCSKCDRGQIYCGAVCAIFARKKSMKLAGMRYQRTFNGKRNHAARQARYRMRLNEIVTHQGSPPIPQHASINSLEKRAEKTENGQKKPALTCHFCEKPVSDWIRNEFLRRRRSHSSSGAKASPQAP
jgi:hypothetical protein